MLRLAMGWTFLWAFLDKCFGLGLTTVAEKSWLHGGSPTVGFLSGVKGPFAGIYNSMAGNPVVDWLFMLGLLLIGLALIFGVGMKVAAYSGSLLMILMWSASLPIKGNPFLDDHLIYLLVLLSLAFVRAGQTWGLGKWWANTQVVKKHGWLE